MDVISQDVGQLLTFTIYKDGAVFDLTGAAVTLVINTGQAIPCQVQAPASAGVAVLTSTAGMFPVAGSFQAVVLVQQGGATLYSKPFDFNVKNVF